MRFYAGGMTFLNPISSVEPPVQTMNTVWGCDLQADGIAVVSWSDSGKSGVPEWPSAPVPLRLHHLQDLPTLPHWRVGDGVVLVLPTDWVQHCELPIDEAATLSQTRQQLWQALQFQAGWSPETHVIDWWIDRSAQPVTAMVYCIEYDRIEACRQDILRVQGIPLMATPVTLARMWGRASNGMSTIDPSTFTEWEPWLCARGGIHAWMAQEKRT